MRYRQVAAMQSGTTLGEKLQDLKALIEKHQAIGFAKEYLSLEPPKVTIKYGKKYINVDVGASGKYMVEVATGDIYGIKAYGVIHRGHYFGNLDTINDYFWGEYYAYKIRR